MRLTRLGDYAVRAVIHLAMQESGNLSTLADISESGNIPQSFLAKVMQVLAKARLVHAYRGQKGGYSLAKSAGEITIRDVVEAVEGPITLNNCLSEDGECERDTFCAAHPVWREAQEALLDVLDDYTIEALAQKQKENQSNL